MSGQFRFLAAALLMLAVILIISQPVLANSGVPDDSVQQTTPSQPHYGTYSAGWGALALINAGLAQGKNRKGLNWFLISIFLGPVATLLLVALFKKLPAAVTP